MMRQVMIPSKENSTVFIPSEFYGKEVEIFVFPSSRNKTDDNIESMKDLFSKYLFSFDNYKFSRDEANDYE